MNRVITIARQFGSGGRELGRRLAEELGFEYYDKEIITEIANHTSLSEEYVRQIVERRPHQLYPITIGHSFSYLDSEPFRQVQSVYEAQDTILRGMAERSDCVIVGRCGDFILREFNPYRIFVYASIESRMRRCRERATSEENLTDKQLERQIRSVDKNRARYYEFYTGRLWDDMENYDLCLNATDLDFKKTAAILAKGLQ